MMESPRTARPFPRTRASGMSMWEKSTPNLACSTWGHEKEKCSPSNSKDPAKHGRTGSGGGRVRPQHVVEQLGQVAARPTGHGPQSEPAIAQAEGPDTKGPGPRGIPDIRKVQALHMDQRIAPGGRPRTVRAGATGRTDGAPPAPRAGRYRGPWTNARTPTVRCLSAPRDTAGARRKGHHDQQNDRTQARVTYRTPQRSICLDRAQVARSFARVTQGWAG